MTRKGYCTMIIIGIAILGALALVWFMRRPIATDDERYWQANDYWSDPEPPE